MNAGVKRELAEISTAQEPAAVAMATAASSSTTNSLAAKRVAHMTAAVSSQLKLCKDILNDCCAHEFAFLFAEPVDVIGLGLTDYHDVIKHPMDFGTIRKRIDVSFYTSPTQFFDDMRLTFTNAMLYNPSGTDVNKMAKRLAKFFEKRWAVFSATGTYDRSMFPAPTPASMRARGAGVAASRRGAGRLTIAERRNFTEQVARLEYDDAVRIAAIVRQRMPELEVDSIDANHVLISVAKLRASVVRECLRVMAQMRSGTLQLAVPGASTVSSKCDLMAHSGQWGGITLFDAAADGNLEAIKSRLGSSWTNVNAQDSDKNSAIHEAARWGHVAIVQHLAANGGNIALKNKDGQTALHLAASQGRDEMCRALVALGANVDEPDGDGDTPLITAAGRDQLTTISTLLELGANKAIKNQRGKDALALAASTAAGDRVKGNKPGHQSRTKY